ncbi:LAQU0S14e01508g1_1 [Lachancea quebecensis]|uniref:LAQU0S14e01508g1_1 n=1 Tax=Lachancea quebecensis TaxID=1654605 RepID=A0A0N7MM56_9SACH|nr:LAQU0S14e01508g1_1 [Lachancea quebecensis]
MFHFSQSPCIFDHEPAVEGFLPFSVAPEHKKRRVCCPPFHHNALQRERKGIRFDITENQQEYVLSIYKNVAEDTMSKAICDQLQKIRNERPPTYHVVRDFFGNEYYVEDHEDEDDFMRHAIANLDLSPIKRQVARQVFKDYEITLNHRGDELVLLSRKDGLYKEFSLGIEFEDVSVKGFDMISESVAVLKIGIKKAQKEAPKAYRIEFQPSYESQQDEELEQQQQQRLIEAAQEEELAKKEAAAIQKQRERAQAAQYAEVQKQEERARKESTALKELEEQRRIEAAALKKREEQRVEKEAEEQRAKKEAEEREREQDAAKREERKRAISQKKAFLVEQKRKRRQQERQKRAKSQKSESQPAASSPLPNDPPHNVVININFPNSLSEKTPEKTRGRSRSPVVLEDVDDEEEFRYRRSLNRSPRGSSIIDDM